MRLPKSHWRLWVDTRGVGGIFFFLSIGRSKRSVKNKSQHPNTFYWSDKSLWQYSLSWTWELQETLPLHPYSLAHRHGSEEIILGLLYEETQESFSQLVALPCRRQSRLCTCAVSAACYQAPVQGLLCPDDGHHCWPLPWGGLQSGMGCLLLHRCFERLSEGRLQWHISHLLRDWDHSGKGWGILKAVTCLG